MRDTAAITPSSAAVSETVNVTAPDRSGNERLEAYTTQPYRDRDAVSIYGDEEVLGQCLSIVVGDESRRPQLLGSGRLRGGRGTATSGWRPWVGMVPSATAPLPARRQPPQVLLYCLAERALLALGRSRRLAIRAETTGSHQDVPAAPDQSGRFPVGAGPRPDKICHPASTSRRLIPTMRSSPILDVDAERHRPTWAYTSLRRLFR